MVLVERPLGPSPGRSASRISRDHAAFREFPPLWRSQILNPRSPKRGRAAEGGVGVQSLDLFYAFVGILAQYHARRWGTISHARATSDESSPLHPQHGLRQWHPFKEVRDPVGDGEENQELGEGTHKGPRGGEGETEDGGRRRRRVPPTRGPVELRICVIEATGGRRSMTTR